MSQLFIFVITILLLITGIPEVDAAIKGGIEYRLPIDYSAIDEGEYRSKADELFSTLSSRDTKDVDEEMTNALNLY